ncbi:MAG: class I SAM-dependent methyltransferase [Candidatus Hydrogenedentota bacterium]
MMADPFATLARYYDRVMAHVDYDRWYLVTLALAGLLPVPFRHADLACGTGNLVKRLQQIGWRTAGMDLSPAMIRTGRKNDPHWRGAVGDLRALPFHNSLDFATCLFDSLNFLLKEEDIENAILQCGAALRSGGVFYFDFVTEEMVLQHFAGQQWTEDNGTFSTTWESTYDHATGITETSIRVNNGVVNTIREKIHSQRQIEASLEKAGLYPMAILDAETWRKPRQKTIRVDVIAVKGSPKAYIKAFRKIQLDIQKLLRN